MANRRRVLFVINSLAGGGAERVLLSLLAASRDMLDEFDFSLVLLDDEKPDYVAPDWLRVHQLKSDFSLARSVKGLRRVAASVRPDVTLAFLTRSNVASIAVAKVMGHRAIISERANTSSHFKPGASGMFAKATVRLSYPRADGVIAVSQGIADDLAENFGVARKTLVTIANPVDADRIRTAGSEAPAITVDGPYAITVSRLTKTKNVGLVIEAFARARLPMSLVILGQGAERDALIAQACALGIADRVIMPGFVANPYAIISRAAFYASGSNGEGFPNGQVEALSLGIPVIATNCASGPSEIMDDMRREDVRGVHFGRYGVLTPIDDADAMASAMRAVMEPERHAVYAAAGPVRTADYSPERAKQRYWDTIRSVLDDSKAMR